MAQFGLHLRESLLENLDQLVNLGFADGQRGIETDVITPP
jgi:hypothetical protein